MLPPVTRPIAPRRAAKALLALAVLVLALVACGGDGDDPAPSSTTTAAAATSAPAAAASEPAPDAASDDGCAIPEAGATLDEGCLAPITATTSAATQPTTAGGDPTLAAALETIADVPQDGLVLGDPAAPARIHVFADMQCPFCKQWDEEGLPGAMDAVRAGELSIEFRALAFLGPDSITGARTVLAAAEQDHAWDLVVQLFAAQGAENSGWLTDDVVAAAAANVDGLDLERLLADRALPAVDAELERTQRHAQQLGITGTPSFALQRDGGAMKKVEPDGLGPDGLDAVLAG